MDDPVRFVGLENHEVEDEDYDLANVLLDLKENGKPTRVDKECVFAYISTHSKIFLKM